jgi:hypothetical protein
MSEISGPKAPKDPLKKKGSLFVMIDGAISGSLDKDGIYKDTCFLEGRLIDKVRVTSLGVEESILQMLGNCTDFYKLVYGIGVSIQATEFEEEDVLFSMHFYGKGTTIEATCPCNAEEVVILLSEYPQIANDDVPGFFQVAFGDKCKMAKMTVCFYVNDGYQVPEISIDAPVDFGSDAYEKMIKKSLMQMGNANRLKRAIDKAKRGEEITIAYIGGSITQGAGAKPIYKNCYAYLAFEKFCKKFGLGDGSHIYFIKAGVGGTPSELGIVRYDKDILRDGLVQPDIVIIEFAVNDEGDETQGVSYESLVLKALKEPGEPAVILLFSVFMNDWNLQERLKCVGQNYELPMVSIKNAIVPQFGQRDAVITKRQFFYDIYHPSNEGHQVMADCLYNLYMEVAQADYNLEEINVNKSAAIGNAFWNMKFFDRETYKMCEAVNQISCASFEGKDTNLQCVEMDNHNYTTPVFPNNWMREKGNDSFSMEIRCKSLIMVFKDSGDPMFGRADVIVDGKVVCVADPHLNNWVHCNSVLLIAEDETNLHHVKVQVKSGSDEIKKDEKFTILGFGYC